jgi:hypothetical protein
MKSAKLHTCTPTTASMRFETRWFIPSIRPGIPRSRASARPSAGRQAVGADGVADEVDSAGSSGVARTPTSLVNGRRKQAEGAVLLA